MKLIRKLTNKFKYDRGTLWLDEKRAYWAGLMDGEGCFSFTSNSQRLRYPRFSLNIREIEPVRFLAEKYNVSISKRERANIKHAATHQISLLGKNLKDFTENIQKYLVVKNYKQT